MTTVYQAGDLFFVRDIVFSEWAVSTQENPNFILFKDLDTPSLTRIISVASNHSIVPKEVIEEAAKIIKSRLMIAAELTPDNALYNSPMDERADVNNNDDVDVDHVPELEQVNKRLLHLLAKQIMRQMIKATSESNDQDLFTVWKLLCDNLFDLELVNKDQSFTVEYLHCVRINYAEADTEANRNAVGNVFPLKVFI